MHSDLVQRESGEPVREADVSVEAVPAHKFDLPPTPAYIEKLIRQASEKIKPHESSFRCEMEHNLHAGMYARTARVAPGMAFTSVMIKIPTLVIVHGECCVFVDGEWNILSGYNVLEASAHRIQAYATFGDTQITMIFPSNAKTVKEAEQEFTDEAADLLSRRTA